MKVALVNKFYPPKIGGIEYHVRLLAQELAKFEEIANINVIVANDKRLRVTEMFNSKIFLTRVSSWLTMQSTPIAPAFIDEFSKAEADLFHFHFPYPFGDFAWLMSGNKKPYCITYHSDIIRQKLLKRCYNPIMHKFFDKAAAIIATSPHLVDSSPVLQKYKNKVKVVPLGIDYQPFNSEYVKDLAVQIRTQFTGKPIVLFVGRLVYYKGVHTLVKALKDVDAHLILIGQGALHNELECLVQGLDIADKVHFISEVSDELMPAYFNACDIFVLPSVAVTEAYGLVQLEAHACGKPVISTNLPTGVPFVNKHGVSGLVVSPGDTHALSNAINKLLQNDAARENMGNQAKKRMMTEFTAEVMAKKVLDVYKSIL